MKTFAVIDSNGVVINVVNWDGTTKWYAGDGNTTQDITGLKDVGIGSTWDGVKFTPPPVVVEAPTPIDLQEERIMFLEKDVQKIKDRLDAANIP